MADNAARTSAATAASAAARQARKQRRQADELESAGWVCLEPGTVVNTELTKFHDHSRLVVTAVKPA